MQAVGGDERAQHPISAVPFAPAAEPPLTLPKRRLGTPGTPVWARVGVVATAGIVLASALAGHHVPVPGDDRPGILVAHADERTRPVPRMHPLADRAVVLRERGPQSRTFALDWARHPREDDATLAIASVARSTAGNIPLKFTARPEARHFRVLAAATVIDGRTLADGPFRITLRDVTLPSEQDMCVMLNGQTQSCAQRLATQLELMVRWRQVVCEYRPQTAEGSDSNVGTCRIGNTDLASRLAELAGRSRRADRIATSEAAASL